MPKEERRSANKNGVRSFRKAVDNMRHTRTLIVATILALTGSAARADHDYWYRSGNSPDIDVWVNKGHNSSYYYGEDVAVYFRTEQDCYVVVYDVDPAGEVNVLFPRSYMGSTYVRGGEVYRVPDDNDDFRLEVTGPSGREHIFAVASYDYLNPPDFMKYIGYDYGEDSYYNGDYFVASVRGSLDGFAAGVNARIASGPYTVAHTKFFVDVTYRHHAHYRYWDYDPYYVSSVWVGCDWPGSEIWIDGVFFGIAPILVPRVIVGYHWVWVYYGGYPCYQRYFYVPAHQRYYIDVRIDHRYKDYRYRRQSFRGWVFEEKKYRNESGFKERVRDYRDKSIRTRSLPPSIIRDYADRGVISKDAPIVKKIRTSEIDNGNRERKTSPDTKIGRSPAKIIDVDRDSDRIIKGNDEFRGTDKEVRGSDDGRVILPERRDVEKAKAPETIKGGDGSGERQSREKAVEKQKGDSNDRGSRGTEQIKPSERQKGEGTIERSKGSSGESEKKSQKGESRSSSRKSAKSEKGRSR